MGSENAVRGEKDGGSGGAESRAAEGERWFLSRSCVEFRNQISDFRGVSAGLNRLGKARRRGFERARAGSARRSCGRDAASKAAALDPG